MHIARRPDLLFEEAMPMDLIHEASFGNPPLTLGVNRSETDLEQMLCL